MCVEHYAAFSHTGRLVILNFRSSTFIALIIDLISKI